MDAKKGIIVYHNDLDGRCSAAIAYRVLKNYMPELVLTPMNYDKEIPLPENPWDYESIYILDYVISDEEMRKFLALWEPKDIVWIDHHKTGCERWHMTNGYKSLDNAGCVLTWRWFHDMNKIPQCVKWIEKRDLWQFDFYGDDACWFTTYLDKLYCYPTNKIWDELFSMEDYSKLIERGRQLRNDMFVDLSRIINDNAEESELNGIKCLRCNFSDRKKTSDLCQMMLHEGYDLAWSWYVKGNMVYNSLRSRNDVDCGKIAEGFGGGGHKYSAGWQDTVGPSEEK